MQSLKEIQREERVHLGVLVEREQQQALKELARRNDRSVSSVVRQAVTKYLQTEQRP